VLFLALPRRLVWCPGAELVRLPERQPADWAELELHPEWLAAEPERRVETSGPEARASASVLETTS